MRRRGLRHVVHVPRAGTSGAPEPSSRDSRHSPPGDCTRLAASGPHDRNWSSLASVDRSTKPGELHGAPARVAARRSSFLVQRSPAAPDLSNRSQPARRLAAVPTTAHVVALESHDHSGDKSERKSGACSRNGPLHKSRYGGGHARSARTNTRAKLRGRGPLSPTSQRSESIAILRSNRARWPLTSAGQM
jgi:hypothetical protein